MKFRSGFVSNSSSSSYICEVCGDVYEAYDEGISRFNLVMCQDYDHLFCEVHRVNPDPDGTYKMYEVEGEDDRIDSIHCPICQMEEIPRDMALTYLIKKLSTSLKDVQDEMRESFDTFEEFNDYLSGYEPEFGIELTACVQVKAVNEDEAYRKAREQVVKNPIIMLDVTHCERL